MASNITAFKERLLGGGSRPNLFEVSVQFPEGLQNANFPTQFANVNSDSSGNLTLQEYTRFLAKSAQIPGMTLGTIQLPYRGRVVKYAGDRTFEPFTITVHNDGGNYVRSGFEAWSDGINGLETNTGTICFPEYTTEVIVRQLARGCGTTQNNADRDGYFPVRTYRLINAWVANVSPIDLNYASTDQISEFSVTFEYDYFVIGEVESATNP